MPNKIDSETALPTPVAEDCRWVTLPTPVAADCQLVALPTPVAEDCRLVTVKQAQVLLSASKSSIFEWVNQGLLERRKINTATRITLRSIRKLAGM